jgi:hypothetical protein
MGSERADEIADEIAKVVLTDDPIDDVMAALTDVMVFGMSLMCPDCRRRYADWLRKSADKFLAEANRMAAVAEAQNLEPAPPCGHWIH